ncbi:MAG: hypothetical protein COZ06_22900 [Armatimonadetes bacterium CG_4_10_14_3_um_filter_66_18]|nr:MAG: hypothetical protein COZ06_22900 [Armatimonadetes bacterium CG_4_10_14_3_um_filter_66_18]
MKRTLAALVGVAACTVMDAGCISSSQHSGLVIVSFNADSLSTAELKVDGVMMKRWSTALYRLTLRPGVHTFEVAHPHLKPCVKRLRTEGGDNYVSFDVRRGRIVYVP